MENRFIFSGNTFTWNRVVTVFLFLAAVFFRAPGLLHGLDGASSFHPDVAKQVVATDNFLQGHVVWYTGSLAYDGYPYGLNHVDAALVRVVWPPLRAIQRHVTPGRELPARPDIPTLYILLRVFRVLYGMVAFSAFAYCLFKTGVSPGLRTLWLLLAATAPLLSTVTHAAAGDVGTDMFVMLTLAALLPAREKPSIRAFLLAGLFTGFAFACKYHGILVSLVPGLLLLFSGWNWGKRVFLGLLYTLGLGGGFALLTPALFVRFSRTVKLIRDNFTYIRHYNVPAEFYEQSPLARMSESLGGNLPIAARALGGVLSILLLVSLVRLPARTLWKERDPAKRLLSAWNAAVLVTPFLILFLALSGKPMVQPFHFSFLPLPFLLGAALNWNHAGRPAKVLLSGILVLASGENLLNQRGELFFRTREDTRALAFRVSEDLLHPASEPRNGRQLAMIAVEGENLSVFRNPPRPALAWEGDDWADHPRDALPTIPHRFSTDWILLDLPVFPRDQTLLHLRPGEHFRRTLVSSSPRELITLQVRNGSRPIRLRLRLDNQNRDIRLDPHETQTLRVSTARGRSFARGPGPAPCTPWTRGWRAVPFSFRWTRNVKPFPRPRNAKPANLRAPGFWRARLAVRPGGPFSQSLKSNTYPPPGTNSGFGPSEKTA